MDASVEDAMFTMIDGPIDPLDELQRMTYLRDLCSRCRNPRGARLWQEAIDDYRARHGLEAAA
jgi:hypothetical protein